MHWSFYTLDPLIESSSWWHRRCLKRSRWQYKQNLRRPQRFPHIFRFQIYWSYINAWSKFKTNAGEHGLPVHHQTRRNASEALVWVSLARKANYFMYATLMLHLCVWILLDAFPSIGSSIQSSIPGGISSLCKPCGFSRLFGHLWWQGLLQAGEWWWPMKQYDGCVSFSTLHLPGLWRHESSEGSCSGKAESSRQFSAVAKASRHLLIP